MNDRQRKFVDYYIQTANASEAARLAGYSKRTAHSIGNENLRKPEVLAEINRRLDQFKSQRTADTQEVLEHLTAVMRGELTEEVVTNSGKKLIAKIGERDRLRAAELLLKVHGAFREKLDVKVDSPTLFAQTLEKLWSNDGTGT